MTLVEHDFRVGLTLAIAEDDRDICECCRCGASDLTDKGLDILADIVMAHVEPLFVRIAGLESPRLDIEEAVDCRDRARIVALNFAGRKISESDGTYELLLEVVFDAMRDYAQPLRARIVELESRIGDERAHWTMTSESGVMNG